MTIEFAEDDIREAFADITYDTPVSRIISRAKRRQHRRRFAIGAVPALGLIAAGGAALLTAEDLAANNVTCFDQADPNAPNLGQVNPGNTGQSPEALCAEVWARGDMSPVGVPGVIPPLTACAMDERYVGVFPTKDPDFCTSVGLQKMPDGYLEQVEPFVKMREDAADRIREAAVAATGSERTACLDGETAATIVEDVLVDHGYDNWTVIVRPKSEGLVGRPCWTDVSFNDQTREASISSIEAGTKYIHIDGGTAFPEDW